MRQNGNQLAVVQDQAVNHFRPAASGPALPPLRFSIATSWDDTFLDNLAALNREHARGQFGEVYGAHRTSITGHGRPAYRLPHVDKEIFERHVSRALALGLNFNYVMNAPDFGGREKDPAWLREVFEWLAYLKACRVSAVTIANPALLQFVRREFPDLRINVSLIAAVDTVAEARRFEDFGVRVINLNPFTINRDFAMLRAIRQAVKCELEVYANIACLDHCPKAGAHYRYSGRASQTSSTAQVVQDPYLMWCSHAFLSEPVELLRSPFIRPEDLHAYREAGMNIIKISDRTESTAFLTATARAYAQERHEGNLFDLIFRGGRKIRAGLGWNTPGVPQQEFSVLINNSILNDLGFIDQIQTLQGPALMDFYRTAAAQAVIYRRPEAINEWRQVLEENRSF